jgi:hypothetical protein
MINAHPAIIVMLISHSALLGIVFLQFFDGIFSMLLRLRWHGSEHLRREVEDFEVLELDLV